MRIFINETYLRIADAALASECHGFRIIGESAAAGPEQLRGKCLLTETRPEDLEKILQWISQDKLPLLEDLVCISREKEKLKEFIKQEFRIVKAAGGLVRKDGKFLLIHRLGKWDLPKGKLEKNEKLRETALREVEEECNIRAARREKIGNTWHSYNLDGKRILKKTAWYVMDCLDDRKMKPQKEEGIEDIRWMSREEAEKALRTSYRSIKSVFQRYLAGLHQEQKNSPAASSQ
jgi:8-oxo-dGTP pyrophosphatase MutT (NUDIX family)